MDAQDYNDLQEETVSPAEDDHATDEPEFDEETLRSNERRSRFFFAAMCFLIALLFLSLYLNHLTSLNDTLLLLGILVFAAAGLFLLAGGFSAVSNLLPSSRNLYEEAPSLTPFETLVQEALASIPPEFQERMNNVHVQVEYEPGEELLRRVGTKEGYTLLGLYEGIPITTYGRLHSSYPETITIFQHTIERYCHGDPDRIRQQVLHTVLHEVAHHFGIDHDEMPIWIK